MIQPTGASIVNDGNALLEDRKTAGPTTTLRDVVFISKATPGDDEFVLWLAPRLEAAGYKVFADILELSGGDRWRKEITTVLQERAVKMLLCCSDTTLAREGVLEEIEIATDLVKSIPDPHFIIPLRMEKFKKVFGIGGLQYVDFVRGWATGLENLLELLKKRKVPLTTAAQINPNWEVYRKRGSVPLLDEPERLTSNWLRISEMPDSISYLEPNGSADRFALAKACERCAFPVTPSGKGLFAFAEVGAIDAALVSVASFKVMKAIPLDTFLQEGSAAHDLKRQDAQNLVNAMFKRAWNNFCRERGLLEYTYSKAVGFHVSESQAKIGARIPWGNQGERRWSMLRNTARGHVWQYGVSVLPAFWPFAHFKLKSRVLFAPLVGEKADDVYDDSKKQHRLRRSICKGWRNKQWHGRALAFLELLSGQSAFIQLSLGGSARVMLDAAPMLFTSPVSTQLPDDLTDDQDEQDASTLGRPESDEDSDGPT